MIDLNSRYIHDENIIAKQIGGQWCLIDQYRRELISLNEVAQAIWELLDGLNTLQQIINNLGETFDVDAKALERDVIDFVEDLLRQELIRLV